MTNRRSFFNRLARAAAIIGLAPVIAFRGKPPLLGETFYTIYENRRTGQSPRELKWVCVMDGTEFGYMDNVMFWRPVGNPSEIHCRKFSNITFKDGCMES